jgi:hypothetical protein
MVEEAIDSLKVLDYKSISDNAGSFSAGKCKIAKKWKTEKTSAFLHREHRIFTETSLNLSI